MFFAATLFFHLFLVYGTYDNDHVWASFKIWRNYKQQESKPSSREIFSFNSYIKKKKNQIH